MAVSFSDSPVRFLILVIVSHLPILLRRYSKVELNFLRQILHQTEKGKRYLQGGTPNVRLAPRVHTAALRAPLHPPITFFIFCYECLDYIRNSSCEVRG